MKISEYCELAIKGYEELKLTSYLCPKGKLTIGWGHTGKVDGERIYKEQKITQEKAQQLFEEDIANVEIPLSKEPYAENLSNDRWDALVSFIFNIGWGQFKKSTLRRKLLVNVEDESIPDEFRKWVYSKGKKLPGLVKRREWEAQLYEWG